MMDDGAVDEGKSKTRARENLPDIWANKTMLDRANPLLDKLLNKFHRLEC
jgi:hypothetical protein